METKSANLVFDWCPNIDDVCYLLYAGVTVFDVPPWLQQKNLLYVGVTVFDVPPWYNRSANSMYV